MHWKDTSSPYDYYYRHNNRLLRLVGLWPYQSRLERILRNSIVNFTLVVAFLFQICQFCTSRFEIESIIKELQAFVLLVCCSMSYYNIILKYSNVKKFRDRVVVDWEHFSNEEEISIMQNYATDSKHYTLGITVIFYIFGMFIVFPSLCRVLLYAIHLTDDTQLILPFPVRYFFHLDKSFYFTLTCEYWVVWVICTLGTVIYSMFLAIITHACALLSLVTFKIDEPFKKVSNDVPYDWSSNVKHDAYEWVKEVVKRYDNAIEFIDMINSFTEKVYLIQMFFGIFLFIINFLYLFQSFQMLQSNVFIQCLYELFMSSVYMGGTAFTIYLNCFIGQKLMDHGTEVLESFYQVSLYELPPRCQKVLPLLIMRSTKPCVISIGGMFVASHDFFARFMNTSLSYAMVCYSFR